MLTRRCDLWPATPSRWWPPTSAWTPAACRSLRWCSSCIKKPWNLDYFVRWSEYGNIYAICIQSVSNKKYQMLITGSNRKCQQSSAETSTDVYNWREDVVVGAHWSVYLKRLLHFIIPRWLGSLVWRRSCHPYSRNRKCIPYNKDRFNWHPFILGFSRPSFYQKNWIMKCSWNKV